MGNTVGSQNKTSLHLSKNQIAFIAGFLEGDGCISAKITPTSGSYRVRVVISFTQKTINKIILEHVQKFLGGKVEDYPSKNLSELAIYDRKRVSLILQLIEPFLVSKKKQAQLAMQIIAILDRSKRGKLRDSEELLEAVKLAEEIRLLNSSRKNKTIHTFEKVYKRLKKRGFIS